MSMDSVLAPQHRAMSVGVLMCMTIVAFQALGVGTAMPTVARDLGGLELYGWAFSTLMLTSLLGTVAAGRDADKRGPVRAYLVAVALFVAGSLMCAAAVSWPMLLAGRALEGLGAGALGVVIYAGLVISTASLSWSLGSFAQARQDKRDAGAGRARRLVVGLAVLLAGIAIATAGLLAAGTPVAVVVVGWTIAGFGIGVGYASVGALVLTQAVGGEEGSVSAALQLVETLGVAAFTSVGGALIASAWTAAGTPPWRPA